MWWFRDVDQVHDMMDDIAEQQDVAKEISDAISNPVAFGQDIDEDELEKELEELEQEEFDKDMLRVGPSSADQLPEVPTEELNDPAAVAKAKEKKKQPAAAVADDMDPDMKELMSWAS